MKILSAFLVFAFASTAWLVAQESAPKRKTRPPTERIVVGYWIWSRGPQVIMKIPRETIEATLVDDALKVKAGNKDIAIRDLPAGSKVYVKLREELSKFTILEIGADRTDVTPIITPPPPNSNSPAK